MTALWLLSAKWLLASVGCLTVGLLAWLLLNGAAQVWPALRTRRGVWLAAQAVVVGAALLPLLPRSPHVAPQIELAVAPVHSAPPAQSSDARADTSAFAGPTPQLAHSHASAFEHHTPPLVHADTGASFKAAGSLAAEASSPRFARVLPWLAAIWLLVYIAGLAWSIARLLRARRVWRTLMAAAHRLSPAELLAHPAFTPDQRRQITQRGLAVMRIDANISPMLLGVLRPILLLPAHLDALTREQQQMIVAHELHHWRVRDPLCLTIAATLQTVLWFNPALRWMAKQMEWALELQCDQHVLAGRPQHQRKQYAASLLQQWSAPIGVAAFNGATITARIRHMQKNSLPALSTSAAWTTAAALASILAASVMLQPALAFNDVATTTTTASAVEDPSTASPAPTPAAEAWRAPLDKVRVTSFYGVKRSVPRTPHKGIDFGAAKGTPVRATAGGTVIAAGPISENDGKYGNTVIIDHGAQRSLYAHLNSVSVKPGQQVQAGQLIGAVGETGLATGPHLHLEVRQNGRNIDPASMFSNLDAYATARALKVRRQQLPSKG